MKSTALFRTFPGLMLVALGLFPAGCEEKKGSRPPDPPSEVHLAKHGGVAVELGEEEFQLEFTFGDTPQILQAYVMDGEMENYVRLTLPAFDAIATANGLAHPVHFQAAASSATGETVGDSALFEAATSWRVTGSAVELTVPAISIRGKTYTGLIVRLPPTLPSHH